MQAQPVICIVQLSRGYLSSSLPLAVSSIKWFFLVATSTGKKARHWEDHRGRVPMSSDGPLCEIMIRSGSELSVIEEVARSRQEAGLHSGSCDVQGPPSMIDSTVI